MVKLALRKGPASWIIGAAVLGLIVVAGAVVLVTQPANKAAVFVVCPLLIVVLLLMMWKSTSLDPQTGRIVTRRWGFYSRTCRLEQLSKCAVGSNGTNSAMLGLKTTGPKTYVQLLLLADVVKECLPPQTLTTLADSLGRFAPNGVPGRDETISLLHAQAAHVAKGGSLESSPLAPYCDDKWVRAGGQAGAAVSIFKLLG